MPMEYVVKVVAGDLPAVKAVVKSADRLLAAVECADGALLEQDIAAAAADYRATRQEWTTTCSNQP